MHGKVPIGFEKPTYIVAMLRHFFRVTAVREGCVVLTLSSSFPETAQRNEEVRQNIIMMIGDND